MKLIQSIYRLFVNLTRRASRVFSLIIVCLAPLFGLNSPALAGRIYVDGSLSPCGDGIGWSTAYRYLQDALAAAAGGDEIWVAAGTYFPDEDCDNPGGTGVRALSFDMIAAVEVYGGFFGDELTLEDRDIIANETILSGDIDNDGAPLDDDNSYHVVLFDSLSGTPAVLDGFFVRDGYAAGTISVGGGVLVRGADDAIIRNCVLEANFAVIGGGIGVLNSTGDKLEVRNCRFELNAAVEGGGIGSTFGVDTDINVINCEFLGNEGYTHGGGVWCTSSRMTFINATFTLNFVAVAGVNHNGGGAYFEGVVDAVFINSLFLSNTTNDEGGAVYLKHSDTTALFENCTFSKNHASGSGGGIAGDISSSTTLTNCILWGNTDGDAGTDTEHAQLFLADNATAAATYTCIEGLNDYSGMGNIGDDPLFVDPDDPDSNYRLLATSPCIDTGDNTAVDPDDFDVDEDLNDTEDTPDLDLGVRIVDGDEDMTATVDMGPYESVPCPWDLDGDCVVGARDLMELLRNWDKPYGAQDLLDLLAAWGPCPCDPDAVVLSLPEEWADACVSEADWDEYEDVMTDPNSSQADKDRYDCWMTHYIEDCNKCICIGQSGCPNPDPFN